MCFTFQYLMVHLHSISYSYLHSNFLHSPLYFYYDCRMTHYVNLIVLFISYFDLLNWLSDCHYSQLKINSIWHSFHWLFDWLYYYYYFYYSSQSYWNESMISAIFFFSIPPHFYYTKIFTYFKTSFSNIWFNLK